MPDEEPCIICRRRPRVVGRVCLPDSQVLRQLLDDLPRKVGLLPLLLTPGVTPAGDKVSTSRVGSPTPARLDALNLLGPGAIVEREQPLVHRWATTRGVVVRYAGENRLATITEWHEAAAVDEDGEPVMVADTDQTGIVPPATWVDVWAGRWRRALGHGRPRAAGAALRAAGRAALSALDDDRHADEWRTRFDDLRADRHTVACIEYLKTWLDSACKTDEIDVAVFATELRKLSAELTRVLGEKLTKIRLGRCPTRITDLGSGEEIVCGVELWQDPHPEGHHGQELAPVQVECPRCLTEWGPDHIDLIRLSSEIRRAWPIDYKRRYTAEEIEALAPLPCPARCGSKVAIGWAEIPVEGRAARRWRVAGTSCPNGCPEGSELG